MNTKTIFTFFLFAILVSCQTIHQKRHMLLWENILENGYKGLKYSFEETGTRNLSVLFLNDSILEISNHARLPHLHQKYKNFKCIYAYKPIMISEIKILNDIECCIPRKHNISYLKPFEYNRYFTVDENAVLYIFPNITGDTIRFSHDLKQLQIREFCFIKSR